MSLPSKLEKKPYLVVKLLSSLKGFYTFKELEEELDMPAQMLWRYTNLMNIPEKRTATKILEKIHERNLLVRIYNKVIVKNIYGYVEVWRYLYDRHFLNLVGYEAANLIGQNSVNTVLVYPPEDAPLALAISDWLGCRACIALRKPPLSQISFLCRSYKSLDRGAVVTLCITKGVVRKGDSILLVKNIAKNWDSLSALSNLVEECGGRIWGALIIASLSDAWKDKCVNNGVRNIKVLREF